MRRRPAPPTAEEVARQPYNRPCAIVGCTQLCYRFRYCEAHERRVAEGADPSDLRRASVSAGDRQCPYLALHGGANACVLVEGHATQHENEFGGTFGGRWGLREKILTLMSQNGGASDRDGD